MKTTNEKLRSLLDGLDRNSNLEYIGALAEQVEDNLSHLQTVSNKADNTSDLNTFKHEFDRLSGRNEVLLNMIFKLVDESSKTQEKSVSLVFEMLKDSEK
ncbi:hypothetical protein [uncultured Trichococcus sp.]|uniref:hypothetical protein n=1 Tax=uncultured Trichococcus sp. TaxID=189665 RepID=UPI0029C87C04|nr:hypothetical protein [uncultured Trichococcus sp.]